MITDKISIIIPCYNAEKYIDRCLQSVFDQSYPYEQMEIICINDASTDNTLEILEDWESRYPSVITIINCVVNGRQGKARNIGLSYSTGTWIMYIDADDWIDPEYIDTLVNTATDDCDMVCCKLVRDTGRESDAGKSKTESNGVNTTLIVDSESKRKELIVQASLVLSAVCKLIRKQFLIENSISFPENLAYEDLYWGSLLPFYVGKVTFVDRVMYHYYINPDSTVLNKNESYHLDMLTVNMMLWEALEARGMYPAYKDEIEYNYIFICFLAFIKMLVLRFDVPDYSMYRLLQTLSLAKIGDWEENKYIKQNNLKEIHRLLLETLDKDIDKVTFEKIIQSVRQIGI